PYPGAYLPPGAPSAFRLSRRTLNLRIILLILGKMRSRATFFLILAGPLLAKTYSVDGIVVAVDVAARTMLVSHREIAHYMPAMLMVFRAENEAELAALHPGARIAFELAVTRGRSVARHIRPTGAPDVALPVPAEKLAIGSALPEFQLTDQHGRTLRVPCAAKWWPSISSLRAARCPMYARGFRRTLPCCNATFAIGPGTACCCFR